MQELAITDTDKTESTWLLILFLAGFCLVLLQFFMIREITALLTGSELVIFFVTVAYFIGYSVGYSLAEFLSLARIRTLAIGFWILHITLPFSLRYWMTTAIDILPGFAFIFMLFFMAFALSSFYSLLLPRLIDLSAAGTNSLSRYYRMELLGAIVGISAIFLLGAIPWIQPILYQAALAILVALLIGTRSMWITAGIVVFVYAAVFSMLNEHSLNFHYAKFYHLEESKILYSVNSPYQKVDIVQVKSGTRYLFLDGKKNYGTTSLKIFNLYLAKAPAQLVAPKKTLIIGAGSMESVRHIAPISDSVEVVEIDKAVPEGSRIYFADVNQLNQYDNWNLTIQDAKSFLNNTETLFDLIVVDIPVPLTLQTALLHSVEFYQMVKQRLTPKGVISISLSGYFDSYPWGTTPRTVAAAILEVFEDVLIYTPDIAERSFAIAGRSLPFSEKDLIRQSAELGAQKTEVFAHDAAYSIIGNTPPITYKNLTYPIKRSWLKIKQNFFGYYD